MPSPKGEPTLSIGEVSELFGVPVSTLRYYDRQGLLPGLDRKGGQRRFAQSDIETLRVVECLKASGLELAEIRRYLEAVAEGPRTVPERLELFERRRERVAAEVARLEEVLDVLDYKRWLYRGLMDGRSEEELKAVAPQNMPAAAARGYGHIHEELRHRGPREGAGSEGVES